jgi:hypothetical protein
MRVGSALRDNRNESAIEKKNDRQRLDVVDMRLSLSINQPKVPIPTPALTWLLDPANTTLQKQSRALLGRKNKPS